MTQEPTADASATDASTGAAETLSDAVSSDTFAGMKLNSLRESANVGYPVPSNLVEVLTLDSDPGDDPNRFIGYNPPSMLTRTFGGQVLGQSLMAACRTLAEGQADWRADDGRQADLEHARYPHSLHAYFLRGGNPKKPITFEVERLRDGRSFSARRVHAMQSGVPILSMIASFQDPDDGATHQVEMPSVPDPESLPTLSQRYPNIPPNWNWVGNRSIDIRHVQQPLYLEADPEITRRQQVWIRCVVDLPDSQLWHASALAYLSDFNLLEPVLRNHGLAWTKRGMKVASLDHAMWFHRPVEANQWLLYDMESPSASGARGLSRGSIFQQDGTLVASVAQEGMVRLPAEDS